MIDRKTRIRRTTGGRLEVANENGQRCHARDVGRVSMSTEELGQAVLGRGIGTEMSNGVGVASAGGILVSGILTMIVMPILYGLFTRKKNSAHSS